MKRRTWIVAGVVGVLLALGTGGSALVLAASGGSTVQPMTDSAACSAASPKLTVQGTGMATGTPDMLTISVGIDVTDPSAQASLADNNSKASAVTTALKQGGTLDKDVQTSDLSIQPQYNSHGVITGYQVTNTLTATLHNFSTAGSIIDALASAAGNAVRVNSLSFSMADPRVIEDHARNDAVHQAVSHAQSMAQAAGERLGAVCSLTDESQPPGYLPMPQSANGDFASAGPAAQVPLEQGSQQTSANVTIVYALDHPRPRV